jgi:uncharacterized membrane protein YdjX (TVP38/TMEM64 family)
MNKGLAEHAVSQRRRGVPNHQSKAALWAKIIALLIIVGGALLAARYISRDQLLAAAERARSVGWLGYVAFALGYAIWSAVGLPASVPSLAAAATFGFWRAEALILFAANLAANIGFVLARYFAHDWFSGLVGKRMALAQINHAVAEKGWKIVMITRLPPVSPFSIVNYAYGLTAVNWRDYAIGTAIGIIPGTTAYIYLGSILGDVAQGASRTRTPFEWGMYVCGFVITLAVCVYLVRVAKAALARHAIAE